MAKPVTDKSSDEDSLVQRSRLLNLNDTKESEQGITRPSEVEGETHVYFPPTFETVKNSQGGKWMIFAFGDMEKLNHRWNTLKHLYYKGFICGLKSSTSMDKERGITMCYTPDCEDIEAVKKAADEIRKLVEYEYIMYYKTNQASADNQYRKYDSKAINKYMHTVQGELYMQDHLKRWKLHHTTA